MKRSFLFRDEERRTEKKSHQRSRRTGECYFRDGQLNQWQWGLAELSPHQVEGYADEEDAHGPSISITSFHACLHLLSLFFHFFSFFFLSLSLASFPTFSHLFTLMVSKLDELDLLRLRTARRKVDAERIPQRILPG